MNSLAMLGIGKLLTKELRFKLIKNKLIQKVVIWKNRKKHPGPEYSLILFTRMFDVDWYLREYNDVAVAKLDPIQHYVEHGAAEKRNPSPWFSTKIYADDNKLDKAVNPFLHFLLNQQKIEKVDTYRKWRETYFPMQVENINEIKKEIQQMQFQPLVSIVIPVYNPDLKYLQKTLDSIQAQIYENWEICLADDASSYPKVKVFLKELNDRNNKVKVVFRESNGHISLATNSAIEVASGEFLAFVDQDDLLSIDALFEVVKILNQKPELSLIYSDEDKIDVKDFRFDPHFKSDWNLLLFYSQNYINHLTVVKRSICNKIGGLRTGFEGSQDYDFLLRYFEQIEEEQIHHIPKMLYHWRAIEGSTALSIDNKLYAVEAGKKALESHIGKRYPKAKVELANKVYYKVNFPLPENPPLVSIIIPFKDKIELLKSCLESIFSKTSYNNYEILLVDNNSSEEASSEYLKSLDKHSNVRILEYEKEFNYSAINNFAAKQAKGEILLLLNNDTEVISNNWLSEMISYFSFEDVAAVGPKLLFEDNTIQHAGIVLGIGGVAGHPHKYFPSNAVGYMCRANLVQNISAVTAACMAVRKSVFEEVGGLEEDLKVAFNDVDLCIKIREAGHKLVFTPFVQLYHYESKSRGNDNDPDKLERFQSEIHYMQRKWRGILYCDPYYNPNLSLDREDFKLAFPPAHIYGDLRKV